MDRVYLIFYRPTSFHSEDPDVIAGAFADGYEAVRQARLLLKHPEDEYQVRRMDLGAILPPIGVWCDYADRKPGDWIDKHYMEHWPAGRP